MNDPSTLRAAALLGALAVALGAFGAHGLTGKLTDLQLATYRTAVDYHFYHTLALLVVGFVRTRSDQVWLRRAAVLFVAGVVCFSGSLYLLSCRELLGLGTGWRWLGPVTPVGGLFFLLGWAALLFVGRAESATPK